MAPSFGWRGAPARLCADERISAKELQSPRSRACAQIPENEWLSAFVREIVPIAPGAVLQQVYRIILDRPAG